MTKKDLTKKQKMIARLQEFTLMDDDFMTRFFENDKDCTQFVLQTILDNKKLKVIDTVAQKVMLFSLQKTTSLAKAYRSIIGG